MAAPKPTTDRGHVWRFICSREWVCIRCGSYFCGWSTWPYRRSSMAKRVQKTEPPCSGRAGA